MHRRDAGKHRSVSLDLEARTSRLSLMGGDCGQRPLLGTDSHTVFCFVGEFSIYSYTSLMSIPCSYLCRSHNPLLGPVPIAPNAAPSFCSLPTYVLLVTFHASIYFSIQLLKHWFSFEERLGGGRLDAGGKAVLVHFGDEELGVGDISLLRDGGLDALAGVRGG